MRRKLFIVLAVSFAVLFLLTGWSVFLDRELTGETLARSSDHVVRLHVLANSDNQADQDTKIKVRNEVIACLSPHLANVSSASEALTVIKNRELEVLKRIENVLIDSQAGYGAKVEIGWYDFPVKMYGDVVYPAGKYEAVRILLGRAEGKNWWCVLFPPLCFVDAANATAVPVLGGTGQGKGASSDIQIRWKFVELLEQLKEVK